MQRTLLSVLWQPGWEGGLGDNGYTRKNSWVPSLFTWNHPNTVNWLYSNIKWKVQKTSKNVLTIFSTSCHKNCYSPQTKKNPQWAMKGDHKRKSRMSSQKERESIFLADPRNRAYYIWDLPPVTAKLQVTPSLLLSSYTFQGKLTFWSRVTISRVITTWSLLFCPRQQLSLKMPSALSYQNSKPPPTNTPPQNKQI